MTQIRLRKVSSSTIWVHSSRGWMAGVRRMRRRCLAFSDKKSEKIVFGNNSSSYAMVPHQTALNFISLSIRMSRGRHSRNHCINMVSCCQGYIRILQVFVLKMYV